MSKKKLKTAILDLRVQMQSNDNFWYSVAYAKSSVITLVNVYVDLVVFTRIAGTS